MPTLDYASPQCPLRNSRAGVASAAMAIASAIAVAVSWAIFLALRLFLPDGRVDPVLPLVPGCVLAGLCALVGIGLGIAGVVQRTRRRLWGWKGVAANVAVFMVSAAVIA